MFDGDDGSNIELLLAKDEGPLQYPGTAKMSRPDLSLNLTSIPSRIGGGAGSIYSHRHSLLTMDRAQSILGFGGGRYLTSQ